MKKKKETSQLRQLPDGFKPAKGRCSFDMPQPIWALHDFDEVEVVLRNGEQKVMQVFEINWTNTFLKTDVVGWRII